MNPSLFSREGEFHYRIVYSLLIVLVACIGAFVLTSDRQTVVQLVFGPHALRAGFFGAAALCTIASGVRMSAGSALRSGRIMSFPVRTERLVVVPPYNLVRNPIYLSDLLAAAGFALTMPLPGLLYPFLLALHYGRIIRYEEEALAADHDETYRVYAASVPRLLPGFRSMAAFVSSWRALSIDLDGIRFNALYLLFIPGFLVATVTGEFFHAVAIGLPAVADWAWWHTVKGMHPTNARRNES